MTGPQPLLHVAGFVFAKGCAPDAMLAAVDAAIRRALERCNEEVRVIVMDDPPAGITLAHGEGECKFIEGGVIR